MTPRREERALISGIIGSETEILQTQEEKLEELSNLIIQLERCVSLVDPCVMGRPLYYWTTPGFQTELCLKGPQDEEVRPNAECSSGGRGRASTMHIFAHQCPDHPCTFFQKLGASCGINGHDSNDFRFK